ncbi:MAG: thioredoxin family protein [Lentisphaeria bacterium]|nr:thioredoxin family protein [Lentisphaeria bacterium]
MKHFNLILAAALCGLVCTGIAVNAAGADAKPAKEAKEAAKKADVVWLTDLEAAKKQAAADKKPILMFFTGSDWCGWCKKLHEDVLDKDEFQKFAKENVILLELDFPNSIPQSDALKKQNKALGEKFKVSGYPTMVLVASDGEKELDRTVGYSTDLVKKLKKVLKKDSVSAKKKSGEDPEADQAGEAGEKPAWLTDFEAAKKQAAAEKKPILMFFTGSDWCIWCQRLHESVLDKPEFAEFSKKLVLVELDFPQEKQLPAELKKQNAELAEKFKVDGYPCTVVLASDGETKLGTLSGYSPEYIDKIQDVLDGKGKPVTMEQLKKQFSYLPDMLVEYEDLKLTKAELLQEILEQEPTESDCERITKESVGEMIQANLDNAILLYLAQKAGFVPSPQLVKDSVMKELDELPADQRKDLEEALKAQGASLEDQIAKLAGIEAIQKQTAMQLFVNKHAEDAAKKDIDEEALKDHYEANRTQYPGSYEEEKAKVMDNLVKAKAPAKASELDKEIANIRKTVKYWKPEN